MRLTNQLLKLNAKNNQESPQSPEVVIKKIQVNLAKLIQAKLPISLSNFSIALLYSQYNLPEGAVNSGATQYFHL